jgi:hypothetical protein
MVCTNTQSSLVPFGQNLGSGGTTLALLQSMSAWEIVSQSEVSTGSKNPWIWTLAVSKPNQRLGQCNTHHIIGGGKIQISSVELNPNSFDPIKEEER